MAKDSARNLEFFKMKPNAFQIMLDFFSYNVVSNLKDFKILGKIYKDACIMLKMKLKSDLCYITFPEELRRGLRAKTSYFCDVVDRWNLNALRSLSVPTSTGKTVNACRFINPLWQQRHPFLKSQRKFLS